MQLSKEILDFLYWLDSKSLPFEAEFLKDMVIEPDEPNSDEYRNHIEAQLVTRKIVSNYIQSKSGTINYSVDVIENLLNEFSQISSEDHLNAYMTEISLNEIPKYVERLRKLISLRAGKPMGKKVEKYYRQATNCYVFGLYDAVAILSRSVLQFALEEALADKNIATFPRENTGYIETLIKRAETAGIIKKANCGLADRVRRTGNKAVHTSSTDETTARKVIGDTAIVLSDIYSV